MVSKAVSVELAYRLHSCQKQVLDDLLNALRSNLLSVIPHLTL